MALIVICLSLTVNKSSACNNPPWAVICPEYEYYEYIPIGEDACFSLDAGDLDGEIEEWEVDFDDGSTPESGYGSPPSEVTHEYSEAGIYEPTLTVWDDWGNPGSDSCEVYVVEVDGVYEGEYGTGPVFKCPGETVHRETPIS